MDVVADLFALVSKNRVGPASELAFDEVREESVKFSAAVCRARQATPAEHTDLRAKIPSVLLAHYVCCNLACSKDRVFALVNGHRFIDAMFGVGV